MESLLSLAHQYAARYSTKILSHRINGDQIIFVLESGPKLTMTPDALQKAIEASGRTFAGLSGPAVDPGIAPDIAPGFSPATPDDSLVVINTADGIDSTEASAAGSALAKRRRPRKTNSGQLTGE